MKLKLALLALLPLLALAQTPAGIRQNLEEWNTEAALAAARALVARAPAPPTLESAEALELLAECLSLKGDPAALTTLDQAFLIRTSLLPAGDVGFVQNHLRQAAERAQRREWTPSLEQSQKALAILDAHPGPDSAKLRPQVLLSIGNAQTSLNRNREAKATLEQALLAAQAQFGPNSRQPRDVLRALSTLAYLESNLNLAEQFLARAKEGSESNPVESAQFRLLSAGLAMERGRYSEAAAGLQQSLEFFESRLGPTNRRLLPVLRNISRCHRYQAQFQQAILAGERALSISVTTYGERSPSTSDLLGIIASIKAESGLLPQARELYDRALAIHIATLGPTHSQVGFELFSLANLEQVMGDFDTALRHAGQALAIREKVEGPQSARTASIYALIGRVNALNGNPTKGKELTELAVAIAKRTVGDAHPRAIFAKSDLGEVLYRAKDFEGAHKQFTESLAGQIKLFGAASLRTAQGEYNLGLAERALGHHVEALERFTKAGKIWRDAFGPDYLFLTETSAGQAASLLALGRTSEALESALESARVRQISLTSVTMTAAEREALLFARVDRDGLLIAIDLVATGKLPATAVAQVWNAVIRDRASVLDAMAQRRQSTQADGATAALYTRIATLKKELAQAALVGDPKLYASRVAAIRQDLDSAERQLAQANQLFARQSASSRAGLPEVLAATPSQSTLIGYARGEASYVAFHVQSGTPQAVPLGPVTRIDSLVRAWQAEMERERQSAGRNARRNEATYRQAGEALRRAIWDPLAPAVGKAQTVWIAPDAALQVVNFDTLPSGAAQFLAETAPLFQILSAERDLVSSPSPQATRRGSLLALGNPAFANPLAPRGERNSNPDSCPDLEPSRFPALPGAATEAQAVSSLWNSSGGRSQVLTGTAASESALKSLSPGKQILHLATHGFFLAAACQRGREAILAANPMLRSGLVLSAGGPAKDDGLLTAEEVSALHLEGTELVVLSGCDTARGAAEAGEGLLGLRRAFHSAGARTVVSSLWPIQDSLTRTWMMNFYQARLQSALSVAQAVRRASLTELRARRAAALSIHPFHWGSFVASGF